jgi:hypothetical protein
MIPNGRFARENSLVASMSTQDSEEIAIIATIVYDVQAKKV